MTCMSGFRDALNFTAVYTGAPDPEPPRHQAPGRGTVHIWSARIADLYRYYPSLSAVVSLDEVNRASGFKRREDARNYIVRHGMVRTILGHYTNQDPALVQFIRGITGKPYLDPETNQHDIRFSFSHTDERICLGISQKSSIGLDIVKIDSRYPFSEAGQYIFSQGERRWISDTAPGDRMLRFFRIWSLKEALLKINGSTARMMKDADVSEIMTVSLLDGMYPVRLGKKEQRFFIHESGQSGNHHHVFAAMPVKVTG